MAKQVGRAKPKAAKKELRVADVMTRNPVTATLPGTRTDVIRTLVKHKLTGLPIVRRDGTLAGFVARKHIFAKPEEEQLAMIMVRDYPSIEPTATLSELARLLVEKDLHHLPVVRGAKLAGIVTPADLMDVIASMEIEKPVEELVRLPCVAVHESTPINVASEILRLGKVFALPVLDSDAHLAGIVSDRDIFNLTTISRKTAVHTLGLAEEDDAWNWEGLRNVMRLAWEEKKVDLPHIPVREIMVKRPMTVFRKTGASAAARIMGRYDFGQLPIVDTRDGLLAMLYELDVVSVLT
ncbi:MAG TPA: CBS domain-containing protein [Thermoplasmata archaeon]|nr:CBS domain-containing protein [Thermoplasmata archaeon]